jgi:hypothetical protein
MVTFFKYAVHKVEKICHKELKYNIKIIVICSAVLFSVPYTAENISNGYYPHFSFMYVYIRVGHKADPCTATFNDLLCLFQFYSD